MSQIDLKQATVYLRDGYTETGLSDSTAAQSKGAVSIAMDGFTGEVEDGIYVMFAGDTTRYKVTAHTDTLGNTTEIVITPALAADLANNTVITFGPHSLAIKNGEGTFSWTEKKTREYTKDRGILSEVRNADQEPLEWSMDLIYEFLEAESGETIPTVREAFYREGAAAGWTSSDPDTCRPYALDIVIEYDPECEDVDKEVVTIPYARFEQLDYDLSAGTIKASGKANVEKAEVDRVAVFGT